VDHLRNWNRLLGYFVEGVESVHEPNKVLSIGLAKRPEATLPVEEANSSPTKNIAS
jgi:hypothetical protein